VIYCSRGWVRVVYEDLGPRGATPGLLSLDPGSAGQIALADDAAGRLPEAPAKNER
jgi:hypothetical protein